MALTADQILALAPDAASAKAGSAQASPAKWSGLGGHAQALWGLCQGSGKDPYRAQIELAGPAFKCTCPSRKFPCKHGLGLYLLYARDASAFAETDAPAWVQDWLQSREQRAEKKIAKQAEEQTPEAIAAKEQRQQKRQEKREGNVEAGLDVLDTWLADLAHDGLAALRAKSAKDWDAMAARLVDTQAPGLAARLRRTGLMIYASSTAGWELPVARELAQLALLSQSYRRLASLPPGLQHDVRSAIGWTMNQDEVLAEAGVSDHWLICGNQTQDDGRIARRTCYLRGRDSGRWALLLQFSAGNQPLPPPLLTGTWYQGTLHFYPSAWPLRATQGADWRMPPVAPTPPPINRTEVGTLLNDYANAVAAQPFIEHFPMQLAQVTPQMENGQLILRAASSEALPVSSAFRHGWHLHALAGGAPADIFGLWSGYDFLPLTITTGHRLYVLEGESVS